LRRWRSGRSSVFPTAPLGFLIGSIAGSLVPARSARRFSACVIERRMLFARDLRIAQIPFRTHGLAPTVHHAA
jgi:hypothetical protein